jgi:uncharacterized protein GlcG (DUF336 family)
LYARLAWGKVIELQSLGLVEAERAVAAGVAAARIRGAAMAFAVTDHAGELIMVVRMDGAAARIVRHAIRKAYTAAIMGRNTLAFRRDLEERGGSLDQWGDSCLTTLQGGVVVKKREIVLGAVACGGATIEGDEEIAHGMAQAALAG